MKKWFLGVSLFALNAWGQTAGVSANDLNQRYGQQGVSFHFKNAVYMGFYEIQCLRRLDLNGIRSQIGQSPKISIVVGLDPNNQPRATAETEKLVLEIVAAEWSGPSTKPACRLPSASAIGQAIGLIVQQQTTKNQDQQKLQESIDNLMYPPGKEPKR